MGHATPLLAASLGGILEAGGVVGSNWSYVRLARSAGGKVRSERCKSYLRKRIAVIPIHSSSCHYSTSFAS